MNKNIYRGQNWTNNNTAQKTIIQMDTEDSEAEESLLTDSEQGPETLEEEEYLPDVLFASSIPF